MTQGEFAALAGVTQPAVAAYEAGRRQPTGSAARLYHVIAAALEAPVESHEEPLQRAVILPLQRWQPYVAADTTVHLPFALDWSAGAHERDLADVRTRRAVYATVLDEGSVVDIQVFIDPDELVRLWPDIPVSRRRREMVGRLVDRLAA